MQQVRLKPGEEIRLLGGHLWVFHNELADVPQGLSAGQAVQVLTRRNEIVGWGHYSPTSRIAVRLLGFGAAEPPADEVWLGQRLQAAVARRAGLASAAEMVRLVHGESDGLPGLVVDRYGPYLVLHLLATGMAARRELLVRLLVEQLRPAGVTELRRSVHRRKEGLAEGEPELLFGEAPPPAMTLPEGDLSFVVEPGSGPKGGFFLDQRVNRLRLRHFVRPGDRVLDLFCGSGGFGLSALRAGAAEARCIDSGVEVLARGEQSAAACGLDGQVAWERADLFRLLPEWGEAGHDGPWDVVVLDPPGLAKDRAALPTARRAYRRINEAAMRLVRPGGTLLTCSCSQLLDRPSLLELIGEAGRRAGRWVTVSEIGGASPDHPVRPGMPETEYLQALFLRID